MADDLPNVVLTLIIAGVILLIGITAVSGVIESGNSSGEQVQTAATLDGTNYVTIADTTGVEQTVYDSRGYAVQLTGANDSYIQSTEDIPIGTYDNYTVSVWASRDSNTTNQTTAINIDGAVEIAYNGTRDEYTGWYYDSGSRASYRVNVTAPGPTGSLEHVVLRRNETHLTIYANTTKGESIAVDGTNKANYVDGQNWDGRLEETRVHNSSWSETTIQNHYDDPIAPITDGARARIMFDEPYRTNQLLFYHPGQVKTSNATFAQGIPGEVMETGNPILQEDYEWQSDGPRIRAVAGGELEFAPVAYVDYTSRTQVSTLQEQYTSAIGLAGVALLLIPMVLIIGYLQNAKSGR
jgi:hypothetical protein